ncbi:MAG: DUF3473 domain-containing protein [Candidatus Methanomethylicaceae archaeon]
MSKTKLIFTVDLEDWFQVENLREIIASEDWDLCESRVVDNTKTLLDLFENYSVRCTFFVLGWIAQKVPALIKEIHSRKHEIASHGFAHNLIPSQTQKKFKEDIVKSKKILEDIIGERVIGYRAPSFSITDWALDVLKENEFIYDSSLCPFTLHKRYGKLKNLNITHTNKIFKLPNGLIEIPISTLRVGNIHIPWAGGAYFRLIPYFIFKLGIKIIKRKSKIYTFYFHPWEIDDKQPKVERLKLSYRIRHYYGINSSYIKLKKLLSTFHFISIKDFLNNGNYEI